MAKYVKVYIEGVDNAVICETQEQIDEVVREAWGSGEVYGKTVRLEEVELTEEEWEAMHYGPADSPPWWRD